MPIEEREAQVDAEVSRLLRIWPTKQREVEETGEYCVAMPDPEGNEFCVR